jgi:tetratricopeptide (TPR) repeat protein
MDNELRTLIEQGKTHFKNQSYKKAETCFKKTLVFKHDFADVYNYMGLIAHEGGHYSEAIRSFEKALKINPRYTEALLNLSILYNDMGEYDRAKRLVKRSRDEARKTPTAIDPFIRSKLANKHADVGDLYWGVGAYVQAVQEYKRALELEERYVDIRTKMAICLRELGKKAEALVELKRGIKDNPEFADAQTQLGITLYSMGKRGDARKIWKAAARRFQNNKTVRMYLSFTNSRGAGRA